MSTQDTEELDLDNGSVNDETENEAGDNDTQDEEVKEKKNKSNWKELSKKAKLADKLERELREAKAELEEWQSMNPEIADAKKDDKKISKLEEGVFLALNPEAKDHKEKISELVEEYGMSREKAWELIQPGIPKESQSKSEFSIKGGKTQEKIDYTKVSLADTEDFTKEQRAEWRKANNW